MKTSARRSSWPETSRSIVLSLVLGAVAGVGSAAITTKWFDDYSSELARFSTPVSIDDPLPINLPQSYAEAITRIRAEVPQATVSLYRPSTPPTTEEFAYESALAFGLVVTSDGWVMVFDPLFVQKDVASYRVRVGDTLYAANAAEAGKVSGWWFIKLDQASGLPVLPFADAFTLTSGDQIILVMPESTIEPSHVARRLEPSVHTTADALQTRFLLTPPSQQLLGSVAVNTQGDVVGLVALVDEQSVLVPIEALLPDIRSLLRTGSVQSIHTGLVGDNVSLLPKGTVGIPSGVDRGFLVTDPGDVADDDIEVGDVIISFNGEWVDERRSLASYIADHAVGDQVVLTLWRSGETQVRTITLKQSP